MPLPGDDLVAVPVQHFLLGSAYEALGALAPEEDSLLSVDRKETRAGVGEFLQPSRVSLPGGRGTELSTHVMTDPCTQGAEMRSLVRRTRKRKRVWAWSGCRRARSAGDWT